jgi:putative SOS response-associated peptidase YedK
VQPVDVRHGLKRWMCNDYGNRNPYGAYLVAFRHLKIRLLAPGGPPNLAPRHDIWPTDKAPIIRAGEGGAELVQLRWGFPSGRPKGPPVINMRSEIDAFPMAAALCPQLISMSSPENARQRTSGASPRLARTSSALPGWWRPVNDVHQAFMMLACEPGPDAAPIHNRQVVVLDRNQCRLMARPRISGEGPTQAKSCWHIRVEQIR